jgi:hypothetical protein
VRPLAIGAFFLVCSAASTACGVLAGLNDYGTGKDGDAAISPIEGGSGNDESSTPEDDGATGDSSANDDATSEAGEGDGETPTNDSGLSADSKPMCSPSSCPNGCCNGSGDCVGGKEVAACGEGGGQCTSCSGSQVCSSGACAEPKPDASPPPPPTCSQNSCPACGSLQTKCCTGSHVCGCEYYWPSSCQ